MTALTPGMAARLDLVLERSALDFTLRIYSDADRLHGYLSLDPHRLDRWEFKAEDILAILRDAGIEMLSDVPDRVEEAIRKRRPLQREEIARGVPPQVGRRARPDWKIELEKHGDTKVVGAEEKVDFHDRDLIVQVTAGQVMFETIPPTRGAPGRDIFGKEIPGILGDSKPLDAAENIVIDPATGTGSAGTGGQVFFQEDRLWIEPIFRVEADVDFNTGNIDFDGVVIVQGSVQDGFRVKATKGIEVHGSIFAAELQCDADITIHEGATMRDKGLVQCEGQLRVKYLNQARVRCKGDIHVRGEIMNSEVRTNGLLRASTSTIYGGNIVALEGVEARQLGSPMLVETKVTVGIDPEAQRKVEELQTEIKSLEKSVGRLLLVIRPYVEKPEEVLKLPEERRKLVMDQLRAMVGMRQQIAVLQKQVEEQGGIATVPDPRVRVTKRIFPKVTLTILKCSNTYAQETGGPLNLGADDRLKKVVPMPW